jgi:hypothetical protein
MCPAAANQWFGDDRILLASPKSLDPPPVGPQGVNMQMSGPWEIPRPDTIWNAVAAFEHDYREEAGKKIHSYLCRRCRLELLLRQVTGLLGTPSDCPEKVPLVRSSEP